MSESKRIRVMLIDDHDAFRDAAKKLLGRATDIELVGTAGDGFSGLAMLETVDVDVLVLDVSMPGMTGIEVAQRLARKPGSPAILALTAFDDPAYPKALLRHGIRGFLLKQSTATDLVPAIRRIAKGEHVLEAAAELAAAEITPSGRWAVVKEEEVPITPREREVLIAIARGYSQREVAERLQISPRTVETHKANLTQKLGITSRAELVRFALERGWLQS